MRSFNNEIDDIQLLNIRLDSLDLEAARSTPSASRSSSGVAQSPSRNPWIFRTALSQHLPLEKIRMPAIFGKDKHRHMNMPASQDSLKPIIHPLHTSKAPSPVRHYPADLSKGDGCGVAWDPSLTDGHVHTRVWASDGYASTVVSDTRSEDSDLKSGVRVERHISSSSEISPHQPAYLE